ncbi:MAG: nicotinate-nucleotide diphosphorylase (carboxylating), partial [Pseudomonadota bacterium]
MIAFADHDETLAEERARHVRDALAEDIGRCDWTGLLVPEGQRVAARVVAREAAVLAGREWFDAVVRALD